jgi:hypothetical protein
MHRDPGVQRHRLDVKRTEKADRDPGSEDRGHGHLDREFAVLPADFLAQVLDLNPHPTLLDLLRKTTAYRPSAVDRLSSQGRRMGSLWLSKPTPKSTFSSVCITPNVELRVPLRKMLAVV